LRAELVRVMADDGLELVGLYAAPEGAPARRAVLHTHGLAGNFYENRFVSHLLRTVTEKRIALLATNNRGHDYRSDNLKGHGTETIYQPGGSTWDIIEHCVYDIAGGARFLEERGHREIVFSGHSLGCNKTVYYLSETRDPHAAGVVLISPPEMFGLQDEKTPGETADVMSRARELVGVGRGDTLIDVGRDVPYTAATFVSMFGDPAATDIFPFRLGPAGDYSRLASISVPILATYGNVEEAVTIPVAEAAELVKSMATSSPRVETIVINGANHVYWGHEEALARAIAEFVSR
jgi:pimeloyl-ACP methyl ester carboxylesterase